MFRYFDKAHGQDYHIHYVPSEGVAQTEDLIALALLNRANGTRLHVVHTLRAVTDIIRAYDSGAIPEETLVAVSESSMTKMAELQKDADKALEQFMNAAKTATAIGQLPDDYVKSIKQGTSIQARLNETEKMVREMADYAKKRDPRYPLTVAEIPDFPCSTFESLLTQIDGGRLIVRRLSLDLNFELLDRIAGTGASRPAHYWGYFAFGVPLISLILCFAVSVWWIFGLFAFFIGFSMSKSSYTHVLLRTVEESETKFCFAYFAGQVCVYDTVTRREYFWKR
jgi:hypothetical protein